MNCLVALSTPDLCVLVVHLTERSPDLQREKQSKMKKRRRRRRMKTLILGYHLKEDLILRAGVKCLHGQDLSYRRKTWLVST